MASPHVAGVMATILSQVRMSPSRLVTYLKNTAIVNRVKVVKPLSTSNALLFSNATRVTGEMVLQLT
jgi:hypothetical protein